MNFSELFDYKNGEIYWKFDANPRARKGDLAGCAHGEGYHTIQHNKVRYLRHRLIWEMFNGPIPKGMDVDHINRNRADDRIENLRLATRSENLRNSNVAFDSKSGFKGLMKGRGKNWGVRIHFAGEYYNLGNFQDPVVAALVYDRHAIRLFGEFAATNFKYGGIVP